MLNVVSGSERKKGWEKKHQFGLWWGQDLTLWVSETITPQKGLKSLEESPHQMFFRILKSIKMQF